MVYNLKMTTLYFFEKDPNEIETSIKSKVNYLITIRNECIKSQFLANWNNLKIVCQTKATIIINQNQRIIIGVCFPAIHKKISILSYLINHQKKHNICFQKKLMKVIKVPLLCYIPVKCPKTYNFVHLHQKIKFTKILI